LGYTELMADGAYGEPSEKMLGILKRLEANGKHLLGLINDVLDLYPSASLRCTAAKSGSSHRWARARPSTSSCQFRSDAIFGKHSRREAVFLFAIQRDAS